MKSMTRRRTPLHPSPMFLGLTSGFALAGWTAWSTPQRWSVFAFVVLGWLVSLCLHEFAHAAVAYAGGDRSVADKGYLTLDPRRYTDPGLSLVLPLLFVLLGGIGLPGGAVWINPRALRSALIESLVALAGPATNVAFAAACLIPIGAGWVDGSRPAFVAGLAFLGFLQVTAALLNLLPIPGLDGFGAIAPHLGTATRRQLEPAGGWGVFLVLGLLLLPGPNDAFFGFIDRLVEMSGADVSWIAEGYRSFRFWQQ